MSASSMSHKQQIHCGWLYKKGFINKSWKRRYFILYSDKTMDYFSSDCDIKPKGTMNLSEINELATSLPSLSSMYEDPSDSKSQSFITNPNLPSITMHKTFNKPYSFTLSSNEHEWVLCADNKQQFHQWISILTNIPKSTDYSDNASSSTPKGVQEIFDYKEDDCVSYSESYTASNSFLSSASTSYFDSNNDDQLSLEPIQSNGKPIGHSGFSLPYIHSQAHQQQKQVRYFANKVNNKHKRRTSKELELKSFHDDIRAYNIWISCLNQNQSNSIYFCNLYPKLCEYFVDIVCSERCPSANDLRPIFIKHGAIHHQSSNYLSISKINFIKFWEWFKECCHIIKKLRYLWFPSNDSDNNKNTNKMSPLLLNFFCQREECEANLLQSIEGTFCLRLSSTICGGLVISYIENNNKRRCSHVLLIRQQNEKYLCYKKILSLHEIFAYFVALKYLYTPNGLFPKERIFHDNDVWSYGISNNLNDEIKDNAKEVDATSSKVISSSSAATIRAQFKSDLNFFIKWLSHYQYNEQFLYALSSPYRLLNSFKLLQSSTLIQPLDPVYCLQYLSAKPITCPSHHGYQPSSTGSPPSNHSHGNGDNDNGNNNNNQRREDNNDDRDSGSGDGGDGDDEKYNDDDNDVEDENLIQQLWRKIHEQQQIIASKNQIIQQQQKVIHQQQIQINSLNYSHQALIHASSTCNLQNFSLLSMSIKTMQDVNKLKDENKKLKSTIDKHQQQSSPNKTAKKQSNIPSPIRLNAITKYYSGCKKISIKQSTNQLDGSSSPKLSKNSKKSKQTNKKTTNSVNKFYYEPSTKMRAFKNISIPHEFISMMKSKITSNFDKVKCYTNHRDCRCDGLFLWMDIDIAMQFNNTTLMVEDTKLHVINPGFVDKENKKDVFCIIEPKKAVTSKPKNPYQIKPTLYTKKMIIDEYKLNREQVPIPIRTGTKFTDGLLQKSAIIQHLKNPRKFEKLINETRWCKVQIFSTLNNKRRSALFITQSEFRIDLMKNKVLFEENEVDPVPILLFQNNKYQVHYVVVVKINNSNIGISMIYENKYETPKVTGIHIDKNKIMGQHQWISLQHLDECECLNYFKTSIDHLEIGNVDEAANMIKNLQGRIEKLQERNFNLEEELIKLRQLNSDNCVTRSPSSDMKYSVCYDSSSSSISIV